MGEERHKGVSPEKGPPGADWVHVDNEPSKTDHEVTMLHQQADVYRDDFFRERQLREREEANSRGLQDEILRLKEQLAQKEEELNVYQQELAAVEDEKNTILRRKRQDGEEVRLLRQQVEILQERLRELERERRTTGMHMYPQLAPAPHYWNCPMCTFTNPPAVTNCEMCGQPGPERRLPQSLWTNQVVCD